MAKLPFRPLPPGASLPTFPDVKDPAVQEALIKIQRTLNALSQSVYGSQTPVKMSDPQGPTNVSVSQVGGTLIVNFQADQSGPIIVAYRVYRATAGTRSAPTTPGPDSSTCVATMPAILAEDAGTYTYHDRVFTIPQLDPANPTRFTYWVASVDDRKRQSAFVQAASSPIETLLNGPGDQSPEQVFSPFNKLTFSVPVRNDGTMTSFNINQPVPISSSTNATPIVVTIPSGHPFIAGDYVAIDQHAVNTNANGWWLVSATTATSITLVNAQTNANSVGNGVGAATGNAYRLNQRIALLPPYNQVNAVANGNTGDFLNPAGLSSNPGVTTPGIACRYIPWYSEQATLPSYTTNFFLDASALAAPATVAISQELGIRGFYAGGGYCTFSAIVGYNVQPSGGTSSIRLQVLRDDNTVLFTNDWDSSLFPVGPLQRIAFNFRITATGNTAGGRYKFRIVNVLTSGTGGKVSVIAPMVSAGNVAGAFSSVVDGGDYAVPASLATLVPGWGRSISQLLVRDPSAPYQ